MLNIYSMNKRSCWRLILVILLCIWVFISIFGVSVYGLKSENGLENSQKKICFFWKENENEREEDRRILYLYASPALRLIAGEENFAVLLNFSLREGWKVQSVQGICEGKKLNHTVGQTCILLDGSIVIEKEAGERNLVCLLRMEVISENESKKMYPFAIQWKIGGNGQLYVMGKDQNIFAHDFCYGENIIFSNETVTPVPEQTVADSVVSDQKETNEPEIFESEELVSSPNRQEEDINDPVIYLGCQETPVHDERYSVRFLFYGSSCPFVQVKGGGVLYVTVAHPDRVDMWKDGQEYFFYPDDQKTLTVCTFHGLMKTREYEFFIHTEDSDPWIRYRNGAYLEK